MCLAVVCGLEIARGGKAKLDLSIRRPLTHYISERHRPLSPPIDTSPLHVPSKYHRTMHTILSSRQRHAGVTLRPGSNCPKSRLFGASTVMKARRMITCSGCEMRGGGDYPRRLRFTRTSPDSSSRPPPDHQRHGHRPLHQRYAFICSQVPVHRNVAKGA